MARLKWDESLDKTYHTGSSHCVLYKKVFEEFNTNSKYAVGDCVIYNTNPYVCKTAITTTPHAWNASEWDALSSEYAPGVAWNGVSAFNESPEGAEETALYADNMKYLSLMSAEEFGCSLDAYTYPIEFEECDGKRFFKKDSRIIARIGQQQRIGFGLCYRTEMGDGTTPASKDGNHYRIHIVYNCICSPSERSYETIDDSPDAITFSWEIKTTKAGVSEDIYTSYFEFDSKKLAAKGKLDTLIDKLYGTDSPNTRPTLPSPESMYKFATTGDFT